MTSDEALKFGLFKIDELQKETGIKIKIVPYDFTTDHGKEMKIEYLRKHLNKEPNGASPHLWQRIHFVQPNDEQKEKIRELHNYLNMCGISSDSGGCCEGWDWEWDWSFNYIAKDNQEAREANNQLYDLFDEVGF